jgi:hypothetical protein
VAEVGRLVQKQERDSYIQKRNNTQNNAKTQHKKLKTKHTKQDNKDTKNELTFKNRASCI